MANKIRRSKAEMKELDLTSFMNLMVVLIPVLLASAEFAKIATVDVSLPQGPRGSQTTSTQTQKPEEEPNKLVLTVLLSDSAMTIGAKSNFLPSIFYKEYHKYVSKETGTVLPMEEYFPEKLDPKTMKYSALPIDPKSGKAFTPQDREEIYLYAMEDDFKAVKKGYYSIQFSELLTDENGAPLKSIKPGDVVYALTTRMSPVSEADADKTEDEEVVTRRKITIQNPADFEQRDLSAYDLMKSMLVQVRDRYPDAEDRNDLIIAAEDQMVYDKIVQLMDVGRTANLKNISIAKLRM